MRRLATVLITAVIIPLLNCCTISYKFNGSAIDYNVYKTIHVGQFPIRAALVYPPLQQMFENALLDYIARNTRLQIVDTQNTDITLDGEITGYNLSPQAVSENAIAAQTRLTISVRVKYTDSKNDKNNVDQTFSAYKDFDSNEMLTDVQDDLCQQITEH